MYADIVMPKLVITALALCLCCTSVVSVAADKKPLAKAPKVSKDVPEAKYVDVKMIMEEGCS